MCEDRTRHVTNRLLAKLGAEADADDIAAMFCRKVNWAVPGDPDALPWIGQHSLGRRAVVNFVRECRATIEPGAFSVADILVQGERAVILGERSYCLRRNGKLVDTEFAIVLTVAGSRITRFRLLEDSFAISRAARYGGPWQRRRPRHELPVRTGVEPRKWECVMSDEGFKPTQKMAANAKKGLELRAKFHRGGTEVGVHRAEQLAKQAELAEEDVKSMHSYFARHAVDKEGKSHEWGSVEDPSAGYIAWLLWGGDQGKAWADRHAAKLSG